MLKERKAKENADQAKKRGGKVTTPVKRRPERLRAASSETLRAPPSSVPEAPMSVSEDVPAEPPSASRSTIVTSDVQEDSDDDLPHISNVGRR